MQHTLQAWPLELIKWYQKNKRDFPWRNNVDVYRTWVCEVMSQQTILSVVLPKFNEFVKVLPTCEHLASCSEETLVSLWAGLGYYARARNLQKGARYIVEELQGNFPKNYQGWLQVPGCGPYTASVISSICFAETVACVDGNVIRVVSRLLGLTSGVWNTQGMARIQNFVTDHLSLKNPGDFNQAMMELGATLCKKANPQCDICPLQSSCVAFQKNLTALAPPAKPRKEFVEEELFPLIVQHKVSQEILTVSRRSGFLAQTKGFPLFSLQEKSALESLFLKVGAGKMVHCQQHFQHAITHHKIKGKPLFVSWEKSRADLEKLLHTVKQSESYFWLPENKMNGRISSSLDRKALKIFSSEQRR